MERFEPDQDHGPEHYNVTPHRIPPEKNLIWKSPEEFLAQALPPAQRYNRRWTTELGRHAWTCPQSVDALIAGDSLVRRLNEDANAKRKLNSPNTYFQGLGGDGVQQLRYRTSTFPKAQSIFLLCGTNDLDKFTAEQITATLLQTAKEVQTGTTEIYIIGLLPRDKPDSTRRMSIKTINHLLRNYCHTLHITYIDPGPDWLLNQNCNPTLFCEDLLHLTREGNGKLIDLIKDYI